MRAECFIIGSGRSLLDLTPEERIYLNAHPRTLAMNKYLLFDEKVGVTPKALFLADRHFPAPKVFTETVARARGLDPKPTYYVDDYYRKLFIQPYLDPIWVARERARLYTRHRYIGPPWVRYPDFVFFHHLFGHYGDFSWATTLDEPLFWLHGSLTTAINLAFVAYSRCDIKLVGVDLTGPEAFYEEQLQTRRDLTDKHYWRSKEMGEHWTVLAIKRGLSLLDGISQIRMELAKNGVQLLCCNSASLLVSEGICEYAPVLPETDHEN